MIDSALHRGAWAAAPRTGEFFKKFHLELLIVTEFTKKYVLDLGNFLNKNRRDMKNQFKHKMSYILQNEITLFSPFSKFSYLWLQPNTNF